MSKSFLRRFKSGGHNSLILLLRWLLRWFAAVVRGGCAKLLITQMRRFCGGRVVWSPPYPPYTPRGNYIFPWGNERDLARALMVVSDGCFVPSASALPGPGCRREAGTDPTVRRSLAKSNHQGIAAPDAAKIRARAGVDHGPQQAVTWQKFFASFFQKRTRQQIAIERPAIPVEGLTMNIQHPHTGVIFAFHLITGIDQADRGHQALDALRAAKLTWPQVIPAGNYAAFGNPLLGEAVDLARARPDAFAPADLATIAVLTARAEYQGAYDPNQRAIWNGVSDQHNVRDILAEARSNAGAAA